MSDVIPENEQMLIVLFCKSQTKDGGYIPFENITEFMRSNGMKYHANAVRGFLGRWAGIKWVAPKLWRLTDEV